MLLTMIALGTAGIASMPLLPLIGVVLPLLIGVLLGNLDDDLRGFLTKGGMVLIPFFAFSLGAGLDFNTIIKAGLPGILLGVLTTFPGGFFNILSDRAVGGSGICGAAASSTADLDLFFILFKMPDHFTIVYVIITGGHFFPYSW